MQFTIFGLGQFGTALALRLADSGHDVTAIDTNLDLTERIKDQVTLAMAADARKLQILRQLDLSDDMYCIIAIGEDFEASLLITAQLKDLGVKHIYARVINSVHEKFLNLLKIEGIIRVEAMAAHQLALQFEHAGFVSHTEIDPTHALAEIPLPPSWVGKSLAEVNLRGNYLLNLLTLRRASDKSSARSLSPRDEPNPLDAFATPESPVVDIPSPDLVFEVGDRLLLFGRNENLRKFLYVK